MGTTARIIEAHSHEFDPKMMEMLSKKGFEKVFCMHMDADFLAKSIKNHPDFVVGVGWLPMWEGVDKALSAVDRFKNAGCSALKICSSICAYDDERMYPVYQKANTLGLPVSFHTGWLWSGDMKHRQLAMWYHPFSLDRVAQDFPDMKILMNHMGHPFLREGAYITKVHKNVYADLCISSDFLWDPDEFWHLIGGEVSGYNVLFKTLFGSDAFSIASLHHFEKIEKVFNALKVPKAIRERAYYKNALDFIGLSASKKRLLEITSAPIKTGDFVDFDVKRYGEPAKAQTECAVSYDAKGLMFKFTCKDKNASKVVITSNGDLAQIWQDDCVEIFLSPDKKNYLHFMLNPKGEMSVDKNRFTAVKFIGRSEGAVRSGAWTAQAFVPFSMFGKLPKRGDEWGFNVMRSKKTLLPETSVWNEVKQTFHNPEGFGKMVFR